ncbi:unnamed protein product [Bemisia tabaci]|uniref:Uncharacterized protein n=1 Tax=Bemisia tabaci TaxID=7038 RepID=A0A9P0AP84_BEMTA|nr:unnamed protein product [Bemisia tabaci]
MTRETARYSITGRIIQSPCSKMVPACANLVSPTLTHRAVDILKKSVEKQIEPEDEAFMRLCCQVMDVNAFETVALHEDSRKGANYESSLRGLYPWPPL